MASGNKAALEVTWTGTHSGPLVTAEGSIPASGKRQETPAAFLFTFEGGKVTGFALIGGCSSTRHEPTASRHAREWSSKGRTAESLGVRAP